VRGGCAESALYATTNCDSNHYQSRSTSSLQSQPCMWYFGGKTPKLKVSRQIFLVGCLLPSLLWRNKFTKQCPAHFRTSNHTADILHLSLNKYEAILKKATDFLNLFTHNLSSLACFHMRFFHVHNHNVTKSTAATASRQTTPKSLQRYLGPRSWIQRWIPGKRMLSGKMETGRKTGK